MYIQSACNTATAMKLCENYIIEADHCTDVIVQCRNINFETDKGLLIRGYQLYIDLFYEEDEYFLDYGSGFSRSRRSGFQSWIVIPIYLLVK